MKAYFTLGITIITLIFAAGSALADDMWSETPDLNNPTNPSVTIDPNQLSNKKPSVDMWTETPNLNNPK